MLCSCLNNSLFSQFFEKSGLCKRNCLCECSGLQERAAFGSKPSFCWLQTGTVSLGKRENVRTVSLLCSCLNNSLSFQTFFLRKSLCERSSFGKVFRLQSVLPWHPNRVSVGCKTETVSRSGETFFGRKLTLFLSKQLFFFSNFLFYCDPRRGEFL